MPTSNLIKHNININLIKKESNNSEESNNNNLRKKKELNQYYIGNDSSIKNNNSTLIDANEYYLNVLESQQLFVNSGLNKIEDFLDTTSNVNDSKDLNVSKEQIQKVITKEKNSSYKKNFNNLVLFFSLIYSAVFIGLFVIKSLSINISIISCLFSFVFNSFNSFTFVSKLLFSSPVLLLTFCSSCFNLDLIEFS